MSNAQTWTIIGTLLGVVALLTAGALQVMRSSLNEFRAELKTSRAEIRGDIAVLTTRVEHIDRDVQNLVNRRFEGPAA